MKKKALFLAQLPPLTNGSALVSNFLEYPEIAFLFVLIFSFVMSTDTTSLASSGPTLPLEKETDES